VLRARIQGLVDREKREVVLVGDINACAAVIDHCEGHLMVAKGLTEGMSGEGRFWGKDALNNTSLKDSARTSIFRVVNRLSASIIRDVPIAQISM
jgi:exonuclease III